MKSLMKASAAIIPVLALFVIFVGCSDNGMNDSIVNSNDITANTIKVLDSSRDSGRPVVDYRDQYPFTFTGHIKAVDEEKRVIVFEEKEFDAVLAERPLLIDRTDSYRGDVDFSRLTVKSPITIYGYDEKDFVLVQVIEIWEDSRAISTGNGI